ncbi:MAG TPA: methylated-DNA--[protein]-cysteine S-methyltransferase [Actinomycetota bacterium]|nr:methylated-DNA--[protein]-cysteine S-methyltransferase [Actinomycetota bacterium]
MARVLDGVSVAQPELTLEASVFSSPVGAIGLLACDGSLVAAGFTSDVEKLALRYPHDSLSEVSAIDGITDRIARYFAGDLVAIDEVETDPVGSPRKKGAWRAMRTVGPGPMSYRELSLRMEPPASPRSAARACATNPVALVVPCHRFVGSDGKMHGYYWGTDIKEALLEHERRFMI